MITNLELYGTDNVPPVPKEVADKRIEMLKANLATDVRKHYSEQDNHIQSEILKAIRFWQRLSNQEETGL